MKINDDRELPLQGKNFFVQSAQRNNTSQTLDCIYLEAKKKKMGDRSGRGGLWVYSPPWLLSVSFETLDGVINASMLFSLEQAETLDCLMLAKTHGQITHIGRRRCDQGQVWRDQGRALLASHASFVDSEATDSDLTHVRCGA